jgi:hypothetical protein
VFSRKTADVANAPSFEDIADDVLLWLDDARIVGHNVRVEVDIISRSISGWTPRAAIDPLKRDRRESGGQAAKAIGGDESLAGWNLVHTQNRTFRYILRTAPEAAGPRRAVTTAFAGFCSSDGSPGNWLSLQ